MNEVKELVEELRNKKSRDNRDLLDRSADMIERLAKELCDKSGCHHKCHDTKDCVVEDEAELLLINENKNNNFEVKSNNELFKQALVEGLNRRFDREIEEAKKIEEMANIIPLSLKQSKDIVEVVRCKDCKYYNENAFTYEGDGYGRCDHPQQTFECECYDMWVETTPDDYCSYGKMKGCE